MSITLNLLGSNPFVQAFLQSDFLGKGIFLGLLILSISTWVIIVHKLRVTQEARKSAQVLKQRFQALKDNPLSLEIGPGIKGTNPFMQLYLALKSQTIEILNKNRRFTQKKQEGTSAPSYLSQSDIDLVGSHLATTISTQTLGLERNLYVLSTVVALAPFLGLLGTVWGILTSFSEMQASTAGATHDAVLGGLSLALATTVIGLLDAIPALIGNNYLRNVIREIEVDMESFATDILASVELQYRQVDIK